MASSGQILNILANLEKGLGSVGKKERTAKKREASTHGGMLRNLKEGLAKAASKGKKGQLLGAGLSTLAALTGMGVPAMIALQFIGSYAGGKMGAGASKSEVDKLKGLTGTKFQNEIDTYRDEVGSDVFNRALKDTFITAATAGMGKGASALTNLGNVGGKTGELISKLGATKIGKAGTELKDIILGLGKTKAGDPNILGKLISGPQGKGGLKALLQGPEGKGGLKALFSEEGLNLNPTGKTLPKFIPSKIKLPPGLSGKSTQYTDKARGDLLSSLMAQDAIRKQKNIYEYKVPESLGRPSGYGGYY